MKTGITLQLEKLGASHQTGSRMEILRLHTKVICGLCWQFYKQIVENKWKIRGDIGD